MNIIYLTIHGYNYYLVDSGFTEQQVGEMQNIADDISASSKGKSDDELYRLFVADVQKELNIELKRATFTHVIRFR